MIDKILMISNLTSICIYLCEIFDTSQCGQKYIILFGDLLQLLPVHEKPFFIYLSNKKINKYLLAL